MRTYVKVGPMQLRVVKVGGSLLSLPNLGDHLRRWISAAPPAANLLVVGGGSPVDAIRELATSYHYDEQFLHWLCIDALEISCRLLAEQLPEWQRVRTAADLTEIVEDARHCNVRRGEAASAVRRLPDAVAVRGVVSISAFYSRANEARLPLRLPHSWETSSDSLAAVLAHVTAADELVLLKSCDLDVAAESPDANWSELADRGIIDRAFPSCVPGLPRVRCINFRQWKL